MENIAENYSQPSVIFKEQEPKTDLKENLKPVWHGTKNLIPAKKGECRNPKGRGKGNLDYKTIYFNACKALGKAEGITAKQYHQKIIETGAKMAKKGDYRFYKDVLDRSHGQATIQQTVEHKGDVAITSFRDSLAAIDGEVIEPSSLPLAKIG